nr:hypothetical protein [Neorhizobium vignae]
MLWEWFWDIRAGQASGFNGANPASSSEILAWLQLTGNVLRREDVAILRSMDSRYVSEIDREAEAIRERETEK